MSSACKRCNFDDAFIIDYLGSGEEYTFCGNCGKIKEVLENDSNHRAGASGSSGKNDPA